MRVAIVGFGHIASALAAGLEADSRVDGVRGTRRGDDNEAAVRASDVAVLAVKPRDARGAVQSFSRALPGRLLISVCAGIRISDLSGWCGGYGRIVRAMPNTPVFVNAGMTVLAGANGLPPGDLELARSLFARLGETEILDESLFDAVTGLSGCGPAYAFTVIAALADGGAALGIPRDVATRLAAQTVLGSAKLLLARGVEPSVLRAEVATPGGATVEGLRVLDEGAVHDVFVRAVAAAAARSENLRA